MVSDNVWHQVHAQREDGVAAMFLIRDVEPRADQPKIFVIELPYPVTDLSGQPDAAAYRRLGAFQEQWLEPACAALGWTFVAWKCEDGSFFLYLYGAGDPDALLEKLAPFDGELGFFNDVDADWSEYAALRELVEQAESDDDYDDYDGHIHGPDCDHDRNGAHGHSGVRDPRRAADRIEVIDLTGGSTGEPDEPTASPTDERATSSTADAPTVVGRRNGKSRSAAAASEAEARATRSARKASARRTADPPPRSAPTPPRRSAPTPARKAARPASARPRPQRDAVAAATPAAKRAAVARKPSKRAAAATRKRPSSRGSARRSTRR
jgi:hypothetical protein